MGEVYRARDPRVGRDVAIKVFLEKFSERFDREARVIASLNHPNICQLYDVGPNYLVMELVEGESPEGPLSLDTALIYAQQIADALEAAHEKGIVHRDLKPGNIKITPAGVVKVLDFGLAKTGGLPAVQSENSPTVSMTETQAGVILGTAAYMSPEQAKGRPVDKRADIWAFGVVLYEMLVGKRLFAGESLQETLAGVLKEEPKLVRVPAQARLLLKRCLEKDPKHRLRDIADAMPLVGQVPEAASRQRHSWLWPSAAAVSAAAFAALALIHFHGPAAPPPDPVRFQIIPPATPTTNGSMALSPDGRRLAFSGMGSDRVTHIWVRSLDSLEARPLPIEISSNVPSPFFWSPDSRFLVFQPTRGGRLSRIDVSGGPAQVLCDGPNGYMLSGGWSREGTIIFGSDSGPVMRVSSGGGTATPMTTLDAARDESAHSYPVLLPDGGRFLYLRRSSKTEQTGLYVGSMDVKPEDQSRKQILATTHAVNYLPPHEGRPGRLLFLREGVLLTQPFDLERLELTAEPTVVADQIGSWLSFGFFSASSNGVLAYRTGGGQDRRLTWFDREGKVLSETSPQSDYAGAAPSPDASRAAVVRGSDIYLTDFSRGTSQRFTFGPTALSPVWSPDGARIVFSSVRDGKMNLYQKPANGSQSEQSLLNSDEDKVPMSWSHDGRFLLFGSNNKKTKGDLWILPMQGDPKPWPFLNTEFNETEGQFSPDGHYIAYTSTDSGVPEVYVRQFSPNPAGGNAGAGGLWLVSKGGARRARWRADGKELFYRAITDERLMSVDVTTNPVFQAGLPKPLFLPGVTPGAWGVSPDGKRFLFVTQVVQDAASAYTVVLNWDAGLRK